MRSCTAARYGLSAPFQRLMRAAAGVGVGLAVGAGTEPGVEAAAGGDGGTLPGGAAGESAAIAGSTAAPSARETTRSDLIHRHGSGSGAVIFRGLSEEAMRGLCGSVGLPPTV